MLFYIFTTLGSICSKVMKGLDDLLEFAGVCLESGPNFFCSKNFWDFPTVEFLPPFQIFPKLDPRGGQCC